jgi:hypothetical protein
MVPRIAHHLKDAGAFEWNRCSGPGVNHAMCGSTRTVGRAYQPRPPTIFQRSVSMGLLMVRRLAGRRVLPMR